MAYNTNNNCVIPGYVNIPIELYKSLRGEYFIAYADNLTFRSGTSAWARLYNPPNSHVNLHINVWTVTDISNAPFRAQFWFNSTPPGMPVDNPLITPSNTAIKPLPRPQIPCALADPRDDLFIIAQYFRHGIRIDGHRRQGEVNFRVKHPSTDIHTVFQDDRIFGLCVYKIV